MANYELAYRMQSEIPELADLPRERKLTQNMYGLDNPISNDFGRLCLLARR